MRWSIVLILVACSMFAACEGPDDESDNQDTYCVECTKHADCREAMGSDWVCVYGCCEPGDPDPEDNNDGEEDIGDDCDYNVAPELLGYEMQGDIDGDGYYEEAIEVTPLEFAVGAYASYFIGYSYHDRDCNLTGGEFWSKLTVDGTVEQDWEAGSEPLPEELGCSTDESGLTYGLVFTPVVGAYELNVYWTDTCGDQSNQIDVLWTITP